MKVSFKRSAKLFLLVNGWDLSADDVLQCRCLHSQQHHLACKTISSQCLCQLKMSSLQRLLLSANDYTLIKRQQDCRVLCFFSLECSSKSKQNEASRSFEGPTYFTGNALFGGTFLKMSPIRKKFTDFETFVTKNYMNPPESCFKVLYSH